MSDSNMNAPAGLVIGTAGHIDHGKTSLVHALTNIDTDRLAEEKRRGISIDLGFAYLKLPSGKSVSFVDVPGHERFIKNMLAGAAGIEAVLLIVAADESVKPQTREHFEICRLLGVQRGIVVLTKADLATPEQTAATRMAVGNLIARSFLATASVIPVSAVTREGIDPLIDAIEVLSRSASRRFGGWPRLPIDRSFVLKGFGTVVTGTLWSGSVRLGETVQIQPVNRQARVRGLQVHGKPVSVAGAGERVAVNLSGIDHSEIERGFVLTRPNGLEPTPVFQASIEWLAEPGIPERREEFFCHLGTSEVTARLKVLSASSPLNSLVQLDLSEPLVTVPGDRFILRRPSPSQTLGGGVVVDAFPPKRLNRAKASARLEFLAQAGLVTRFEFLVSEKKHGLPVADLVRFSGRTHEEVQSALSQSRQLLLIDALQRVVSENWLTRQRELLIRWLEKFHLNNPALPGAPIAQARRDLDPQLANFVFSGFPSVRIQSDLIALASHQPQISERESADLLRIEQAFRNAGFQPANALDVLKNSGADLKSGRPLLEKLVKSGKLVRLSNDLIFHADVLAHIRASLSSHRGRRFSVPEFKEWTNISRKFAIPLLEYLDHQHVTRREGDNRIVL